MKSVLRELEKGTGIAAARVGESKEIRYLAGYPLQYRFDASRGVFNVNGKKPLTKKGEAFIIKPCAYRIFADRILGYNYKRWSEFFFLNDDLTICNLLVHGYSVENLMQTIQAMYYDDASLCQVCIDD